MQSAATDVANAPVAGAKTAQRPSIPEARCQIPESPAVGAAKSVGKTSPAAAGSAGAGGVSELEQALRRYVYASLREFGLQLQAHPIFFAFFDLRDVKSQNSSSKIDANIADSGVPPEPKRQRRRDGVGIRG